MKQQILRRVLMAGVMAAALVQAGTSIAPPVPTCYPCSDMTKMAPPVPTCYPCEDTATLIAKAAPPVPTCYPCSDIGLQQSR